MPLSKYSKTSLKSYLVKSQGYLSLLILVVCVVALTTIATHTFKKYSEYNLQLVARSLSEQLQAAVVFDDLQSINETLDSFMHKYPLESIQVTRINGQAIAQVKDTSSSSFSSFLEKTQAWLISDASGYANVIHNGQTIAQVKVINSTSPFINFLKLFILVFFASLIFALMIISLSTQIIYRRINASLDLLTHTTEMVTANRDFNQRIPAGNIYEFNKIASSFNALLNEIQVWHANLQQENTHLEHRALHDPLTQLPNRDYFNQRLIQLFEHQENTQNFALLYIDSNGFKQINDQYGHLIGDAVLKEMGERIRNTLRSNDFFARIGGDEFAVILFNINKPAHAIAVAENLLKTSSTPLTLEDNSTIFFSFSIGIALSSNAASTEELIHQADQAMYQAKANTLRKLAIFGHSV